MSSMSAMRRSVLHSIAGLLFFIQSSNCTFSSLVDITIWSPEFAHVNHQYFYPSVAVEAGSHLVLRCSLSKRHVEWLESSSDILDVDNIRSADVGLFTCCDKKSHTECSSIHVFVRNDVSSAGLISRSGGSRRDPVVLALVQHQPAVIPCKPNAPETGLVLKSAKTWKKITDSGFIVKYDPTVGFSLPNPTWTEEWSVMKCATLSSIDELDIVINWHVAPINDPIVSLRSTGNRIRAGSELTMTCSVETEGETITHILWKHQNTTVSQSKRVHQLTYLPRTKPYKSWIQLTIEDVTSHDSGTYRCEIRVSGSQRLYASQSLQVLVLSDRVTLKSFENPLKVINLVPIKDIIVEVGKNLTLTAEFENPHKCALRSHIWTHVQESNGHRIVENVSEKDTIRSVFDNGTFTRIQLMKYDIQSRDAGMYTLAVLFCDHNGSTSYTVNVPDSRARVRDGKEDNLSVVLSVVLLVGVLLLMIFFVWIGKLCQSSPPSARIRKSAPKSRQSANHNVAVGLIRSQQKSMYSGMIIPRSKLRIEPGLIGKGAFGCVSKGQIQNQEVAIKRLREGERREHELNLIDELVILDRLQSQGGHENIVQLIGVCFDPQIMLVFEYCPGGNLTCFLKSVEFTTSNFAYRVNKMLSTANHCYHNFVNAEMDRPVICIRHILRYASQVAAAMKFLGDRKVIHRDVAARNVLVTSIDHVKLCDLGLAKLFDEDQNIEYRVISTKKLPYKWLALESFGPMGSFTPKSDVWAFGIFLWELFELGKLPYEAITDPQQLVNFLMDGNRLPRPSVAPEAVYCLMMNTWKERPDDRPEFDMICMDLEDIRSHFDS